MEIEKIYSALEKWVKGMNEEPASDVIAFNFGLFESEEGYMSYLIGAKEYDPEDDDWACDESYTPANRYFLIPDSKGASWEDVQNVMTEVLKKFVDSDGFNNTVLSDSIVITIGFDDGELERIR